MTEWWMQDGWARYGSQLQLQLYVNRKPDELTRAVFRAFPDLMETAGGLDWKVPLERNGFAEPRDKDFLRAVGLEHAAAELRAFWPKGGPVWDALAVGTKREAIVLVEGKAHPPEIYGGGSRAGESGSAKSAQARAQIERALEETQKWLEIEPDAERWIAPMRPGTPGYSSLYQTANRYAHLYWLREKMDVAAWLVHVLFVDDQTFRPTSREDWEAALVRVQEELGLKGVEVPCAGHVFIEALEPNRVLG